MDNSVCVKVIVIVSVCQQLVMLMVVSKWYFLFSLHTGRHSNNKKYGLPSNVPPTNTVKKNWFKVQDSSLHSKAKGSQERRLVTWEHSRNAARVPGSPLGVWYLASKYGCRVKECVNGTRGDTAMYTSFQCECGTNSWRVMKFGCILLLLNVGGFFA